MSNSKLEERLLQHIKEIGLTFSDEDTVIELTRRAIREALFQPLQRAKDQWGRIEEIDSPVVSAAREIAHAAIKTVVDAEVQRLRDDPEAVKAIRQAIVSYLPQAIMDASGAMVQAIVFKSQEQVLQRLQEAGLLDPNKIS